MTGRMGDEAVLGGHFEKRASFEGQFSGRISTVNLPKFMLKHMISNRLLIIHILKLLFVLCSTICLILKWKKLLVLF
jgi:hypothetical protein